MRLVRALWHPLAPVVLVAAVLPAATLLAPADQRVGWLVLNFLVGSPLAAVAATLALRSALAAIPVPAGALGSSPQERTLVRAIRALLILVAVLGPLTMYLAAAGAQAQGLPPHQIAFLCLVPLFFTVLGWRLWRDLVAARRRRAQGLEPLPFERSTWTGDPRLDALLGRKPRWTARLVWIVGFASALAFLSPGHALLAQLAKVNALMPPQPWRFVTASFVHGELVGLAVSAMAFFAVAPLVEVLLGPRWLLGVFVVGGTASTLASFVFVPANAMGSTGAIAALTGLLLFFAVRMRSRLPPATAQRIALHGLAAVLILVFAGVLLPSADTAAHLGGFAFGSVVGLLVAPSPAVLSAMERARRDASAAAA
jgi:membrane associated rhomboid family serine protease